MAREPVVPDAETTLVLAERARWAGRMVWACLLLLALSLSLGIMVWPPVGKEPNVTVWAVAVVPLAAFLPGLRRRAVLTHLWLSLLMLLYMTVSMQRLFMPEFGWTDVLAVASEIILFLASLLFVRWRARELRGRAVMDADK